MKAMVTLPAASSLPIAAKLLEAPEAGPLDVLITDDDFEDLIPDTAEDRAARVHQLREAGRWVIHSRGGSAFKGFHLLQVMQGCLPAPRVHVAGLACGSAALLLAGARRSTIVENGFVGMVKPWGAIHGTCSQLEDGARLLGEIENRIVAAHLERVRNRRPISEETVAAWVDESRWFNAEQALEVGLVDAIEGVAP